MTNFAGAALANHLAETAAHVEAIPDFESYKAAIRARESLAVRTVAPDGTEEVFYRAADPGYPQAFTRDSLIAMSLGSDKEVLRSQVDYSFRRLGRVESPFTGEEPGKAHHQLPGVEMNGRRTDYNACDTTADLLRSTARLALDGDNSIIEAYADKIAGAVSYIKKHVNQHGLFEDDPSYAGAVEADGRERHYALKITYWKDSELNRTGRREPNYPIVYSLAHFQNAYALQQIGRALGDDTLERFGQDMTRAGLDWLWRGDHFVTAIDGDGEIDGPSSDSLAALLYIPDEQLPSGYAKKVERCMGRLQTPAGYRAGIPVVEGLDPYHTLVWSHEQALLNAAARRHSLEHAVQVTQRIVPFIVPGRDYYPEALDPITCNLAGNSKQLWAIEAALYFQNPKSTLF